MHVDDDILMIILMYLQENWTQFQKHAEDHGYDPEEIMDAIGQK